MRDNSSKKELMLNENGVTLIELLVVLVISAIVVGGIYKVFIAQTKAYTVQDQVAEIQQDVRGAMQIMVRDIRMAGFQTNSFNSALISGNRIVTPLNSSSITVNYEYIPSPGTPTTNTVTYRLELQPDGSFSLSRTFSIDGVPQPSLSDLHLLDNVTNLNFSYGIDANGDGTIDGIDPVTGIIPDDPKDPNDPFKSAATVNSNPTAKIFAVRIILTAKTASPDPDVTKVVSQRTLTSVVIPRNIFFKKYQAY